MNEFTQHILDEAKNHTVFSIDKIMSKDKKAAKIFVLFMNGKRESKIVKYDSKVPRCYKTLRRECLNIKP